MSEQSAKPYLVRAICEWCAKRITPYLAVKVNGKRACR
jgi:stringent starvation protein B